MTDRTVSVDIVANDKTDRATRAAERNFERLDRKSKSTSKTMRTLEQDAERTAKAGEEVAGTFASAFEGGIMSSFKALPPEAKAALAASLAAAALAAVPAIVTTMDAAILAGVGAGGLAAGIALAVRDPAVSGAFNDLGSHVMTRLDQSVAPFKAELKQVPAIFRKAFDEQAPAIDRIFKSLSATIRPLSQGLADAFSKAMPGFEKAIKASVPLLQDLARELPKMGKFLGDFFSAVADAGPGAELAFKFILLNVEALIKGFQLLVQSVGPAANLIAKVGEGLGLWDVSAPNAVAVALNRATGTASGATVAFGGLSGAVYNTAQAADQANAAFNRLFGEMLNVDQANLAVKAGMASLTDTIKGNKKTLDENTEAGRQNVGAILQQIQALDAKRQADIAAGNGTKTATDKANAAYAAQVASLRAVLVQMGLTAAEVDALIAKYQQIPRSISTTITTTYRTNGTPQQGHSRYAPGSGDFGGPDMGGWAPARFAASESFNASGGGGRTMPPYEVLSKVDVTNNLFIDGEPIRAISRNEARKEQRRADWKNGARR